MGNTYHPPYKSIPFILKQFLSTLSKVNVENFNPSLNGGFIQTFKDFLDTGWGRLPPQKGRSLYLLCLQWNSINNITLSFSLDYLVHYLNILVLRDSGINTFTLRTNIPKNTVDYLTACIYKTRLVFCRNL